MFSRLDHVIGACEVRVHRLLSESLKKPDISHVNSNLFIGGTSEIGRLSKAGINAILDLRKEAADDPDELLKYSISYLHIGIQDRGTPSIEQTMQALEWIKDNIGKGKKIFIHCNLGRGRAPLMTCLYLVSQRVNTDEAISIVRNTRKYTYFNKSQLQWIDEFQKLLGFGN